MGDGERKDHECFGGWGGSHGGGWRVKPRLGNGVNASRARGGGRPGTACRGEVSVGGGGRGQSRWRDRRREGRTKDSLPRRSALLSLDAFHPGMHPFPDCYFQALLHGHWWCSCCLERSPLSLLTAPPPGAQPSPPSGTCDICTVGSGPSTSCPASPSFV